MYMPYPNKRSYEIAFPYLTSKRPIQKHIHVINMTLQQATQSENTILSTTFPCTLDGIRWFIRCRQISDAQVTSTIAWAIVVCRNTEAPNTLQQSGELYVPQENVIAWGCFLLPTNGEHENYFIAQKCNGHTKTMRKLQTGDELIFIAYLTNELGDAIIYGAIQYFLKM